MTLPLYTVLKLVHVLAVVLFLGNITTGIFWKANADRTRNPIVIGNMLEGIIRADRLFTMPPVFVILAAGMWAAIEGNFPILGTGWIFWSIVLFTISGISFGAKVGPLQRKMLTLVRSSVDSLDWPNYQKLSGEWKLWGAVALLAPAIAAALMVLKPAIPGLRQLLGR